LRIFAPLRRAPVALLWGALSLSAIGDQLYMVALTWIAVRVLGSDAGYLSALEFLVVLLAVLGIGRWADRWDPLRSMVGADLCRAAILLAVVGFWLLCGHPTIAGLVIAILVLACGQAVFEPALQTVLPALVDDLRLLPASNGLLDATERSARLLGPGLVALLAGIIPVVHFLTLDAATFLASAAALVVITRLPIRGSAVPLPDQDGIWQSMTRGARAMAGHPLLGFVLATVGLLNGAWYGVLYLCLPLLIQRHGILGLGGSGLGAFGCVISAYGCTNLAATIFWGGRSPSARPQFQIFAGELILGVGIALMGCASFLPRAWILPGLMGAAALGALGGPMKDIPVAVLRQTRLRPADMAAGMRAYMAASSAGMLAAMLVVPAALRSLGIVPVILACAAIIFALGVIGLARYAGWTETTEIDAAALP
jgi:DHA3 family macrolide efflux protein-like MFS transporter